MDPSYNLASKDDIWRLQTDMKSFYAVQTDHADRLVRLERRYDDDSRVKSVWGTTSSVPSVRGGTPHQDSAYNPAAEAFRNFDQDHSNSLLGSLHIEPDEEPRRGTSRANSVRFDESALHGQLTHTSRSSSDFFPIRTGSGFGSHPLTERSSSHKSEGRHSSAGASAHSTAFNGLTFDASSHSAAAAESIPRPAPGLFILGPCPSIIRCWVGAKFSNESLRYAAVCTGASKSTITRKLVEEASLAHLITVVGEESQAKLQIYFPEATVRRRSLGSSSPAPQLPATTATLTVVDSLPSEPQTIQLFLGSDVLRAKSADILFSQDRLVLYDDDGTQINVPLTRPENSDAFKNLATTNFGTALTQQLLTPAGISSGAATSETSRSTRSPVHAISSSTAGPPTDSTKPSRSRIDWSRARMGQPLTSSSQSSPRLKDSESARPNEQTQQTEEPDGSIKSPTPVTPGPSEADDSWASWRRGVSTVSSTPGSTFGNASTTIAPANNTTPSSTKTPSASQTSFSAVASSTGTPRASTGKGMKVLKTRRTSSTRSTSTSEFARPDASPLPPTGTWGQVQHPSSTFSSQPPLVVSTTLDTSTSGGLSAPADSARRTQSIEYRSPIGPPGSATKPSNPVGGASAFGWLNSGQR